MSEIFGMKVESYPLGWDWKLELRVKAERMGYEVIEGSMECSGNKYWCKVKK